ncbi:type II toxin-antitoxin system RelE/ParE family toxin [Alicycliphilus denitrificans]|uniref:type II toxin-antitoxin system RelE/ParE family toxin n=1 Tax=Alicycliphilus denitrificans TaxID=179636 RepID=UPI003850D7D1
MYRVEWSAAAHEDIAVLFDYVAEHAAPQDALDLCERLLSSTEKLPLYPRLYEAAPEYGEGIRRISLMGQHVLYEVDDTQHVCVVLAVVGQRQNARSIR